MSSCRILYGIPTLIGCTNKMLEMRSSDNINNDIAIGIGNKSSILKIYKKYDGSSHLGINEILQDLRPMFKVFEAYTMYREFF